MPIFRISKELYVLFKFVFQQLFLLAGDEFLLRELKLTLRKTELDRIDISCNTECSIRQLELNVFESNYYAIKI